MAGEYTSQEPDMKRVTNLRNIAGSAHTQGSTEESLKNLIRANAELGRRLELELDRVFGLLRNLDAAVAVGVANTLVAAEAAAEAGGLWEYIGGNLVPKDPT